MENNKKLNHSEKINFQHLRSNGQRFHASPWLIVYWNRTKTKNVKILWNLSRKVSNSVIRNKLKRWCREFIRIQMKDLFLNEGLELNFVFKPQKNDFYKGIRSEEVFRVLSKFEKNVRNTIRKSL